MSRFRSLQSKHLAVARADWGLPSCRQIPTRPLAAYRWIAAFREARGIRMRRKVPTATKWAKLTTQLPWCTLVTADWNRLSTEERAITLIHESVHHAQQERWGAWRFTWMYANAKWRLAIELHAYRSNVRTMKAWGMGELSMRVMVRRIARSLVSTYRLGRLRGVESLAIKILSEEIDR